MFSFRFGFNSSCCRRPMTHLLGLLTAVQACITSSEATCNVDQQNVCSQAVADGRLGWLSTGGECITKQYVQFTHLCSVYNYLPSVDYCCCALHDDEGRSRRSPSALCCRYHQDWNHFRCLDSEDVVSTGFDNHTHHFLDNFAILELPLQILLPVIIAFLVVLFCCLACCFRTWCCDQDKDSLLQTPFACAADSEYYSEKLPINFPLSDGSSDHFGRSSDHLGRSSDHLGRTSDHLGRRILSPFSMRKMRYNRPTIMRNQSEPRDTNQWNIPDRGDRDLLGRGERDSATVIPSAPEIFELEKASVTVCNVSSLPAAADPLRETYCSGSLTNTATPQNPDAHCSTGYNPTRQQHQRHYHMFATASPGHPFLVLTSAPDWIPEYQSICPLCSNQNSSLPSYAASVGGVCTSAATVANQSAAGAFV